MAKRVFSQICPIESHHCMVITPLVYFRFENKFISVVITESHKFNRNKRMNSLETKMLVLVYIQFGRRVGAGSGRFKYLHIAASSSLIIQHLFVYTVFSGNGTTKAIYTTHGN